MKLAGRLFVVSLALLWAYPHSFVDWCGSSSMTGAEREFNYYVYSAWIAGASFAAVYSRVPRAWAVPLVIVGVGALAAGFDGAGGARNALNWAIRYLPWGVFGLWFGRRYRPMATLIGEPSPLS